MAGSNKRQRGKIIASRCLDEEFTAIAAKAEKAGLAVAAFMRAAALGYAGARAQRRPLIDHKALRQYIGQVGRLGNNINQIARALNSGEKASLPELQQVLRACIDILNRINDALGKKHGPEP